MRIKGLILIVTFICSIHNLKGQDNTLSIDNALDIVRKFHPVVKQSFLRNEIAKNELRASNGVFDPVLEINNQEKTFDNKLYYKYTTSEFKIPLWYGVDIKVGAENNIGERIDPTLTKNQNAYAGVSIDPFRGFIVDKRRAIVNQAKNMVELTKNEQLLVINDMMFEVATAYWSWVNSYYNYAILTKTVKNNKERFEIVKNSFYSGDRAPIDTTEALTQLQNFEVLQAQAEVDLQKARFDLNNYFWTENGLPFELEESITPATIFEIEKIKNKEIGNLEELLVQATLNHPKIKMNASKLKILDIEKRMKTVELFPSLKLNYNVLDNNLNTIYSNINSYNTSNNYKYGLSFSLPLFQRQARGQIAKTKNKIEDLNWDKKYLTLEIENKVRNSFAEFQALKKQINGNEQIVKANKLLFDTENAKFQMGESSLFLINSRELKLIETEQKNIALKAKLYLSIYKNIWSRGVFN